MDGGDESKFFNVTKKIIIVLAICAVLIMILSYMGVVSFVAIKQKLGYSENYSNAWKQSPLYQLSSTPGAEHFDPKYKNLYSLSSKNIQQSQPGF